ncbi:MAG: hypothetical protein K6G22_03645, partial [Lachnospiraceae bacterium]|nr:hypothetical protein [Lachnospiraceae bacterium]
MEIITLKKDQKLFLKEGNTGYLVKNGDVLVTLKPYENNIPLRQLYLGCATVGDYIPAPVSCLPDTGNISADCFDLILRTEGDEALLEVLAPESDRSEALNDYLNGSVFRLSDEAGFYEKPDDPKEFWQTVFKKYRKDIEDKLERIEEKRQEETGAKVRISKIISSSFLGSSSIRNIKTEHWDGGVYDAAAFLCKQRRIKIIPYDQIKK